MTTLENFLKSSGLSLDLKVSHIQSLDNKSIARVITGQLLYKTTNLRFDAVSKIVDDLLRTHWKSYSAIVESDSSVLIDNHPAFILGLMHFIAYSDKVKSCNPYRILANAIELAPLFENMNISSDNLASNILGSYDYYDMGGELDLKFIANTQLAELCYAHLDMMNSFPFCARRAVDPSSAYAQYHPYVATTVESRKITCTGIVNPESMTKIAVAIQKFLKSDKKLKEFDWSRSYVVLIK